MDYFDLFSEFSNFTCMIYTPFHEKNLISCEGIDWE